MVTVIIKITLALALCNILALSFLNDLLSDITNGEYSNLVFSSKLGLCPKSSPINYLHFFERILEDKADILDASLPKSYWAWFALILSSRILSSSANVIFIKIRTNFL